MNVREYDVKFIQRAEILLHFHCNVVCTKHNPHTYGNNVNLHWRKIENHPKFPIILIKWPSINQFTEHVTYKLERLTLIRNS